ncbi:hypothetical protein ATE47_01135 [Chryseobacterium sp. IHB B 17019]|uniref:DUF3945 domain-containing protein n=1 Tax=Chryseobacterium sp. IHB B 17019 TaxID=1721091 RepID=UPI00071F2EF4|nr:DUF3945 domain-containing protein [Chryseobacterium sp. IHB B 17019]ALR29221.1 hypothetical protein ATE47_01135 [Chryseobacterium sp. IHB B 17019]
MNESETLQQETPEQLSDILLVLNKETMKIEAVKKMGKDGRLETVSPLKKNENQFMKVDKNGDIFSNFFTNFLSQLKNPSNFSFFKVPASSAVKTANELQKAVATPSVKGDELLSKFEVSTTKNQEKQNEHQNKNNMENTQTTTPTEGEYRYKAEEIDWDTMSKLGLTKEKLEKNNLLDGLLKGYKTNDLVPISLNLGTAITRLDARLSLQRDPEGNVVMAIHGIRKEPSLSYPFFGHEFTKEDKDNLLKTGNMGRVVDLQFPKSTEKTPAIISIDKKTNEIVALRADKIKVPDEYKQVKLTEDQKKTLMEGKPLYLVDMISTKGEPFSSIVQFNAEKRYVEILFDKGNSNVLSQKNIESPVQEAPRLVRGKELSDEEYKKFSAGERILVPDFKGQNKKEYGGYITFDQKTGKTDFSFANSSKKEQIQQDKSEISNKPQKKTKIS